MSFTCNRDGTLSRQDRHAAVLFITHDFGVVAEIADRVSVLKLGELVESGPAQTVLKLVPELQVETVESSCCGMAGAFGYGADTIDVSLAMGELSLLPAVRKAPADAIIVADGTSCRHQIHDGTGREAVHVARVLAECLQ